MILWNRNEQIPYPTVRVLSVLKLQPLLEKFPESRYLRMGLRDRYGILATAFDSRFISNRFKLERNIRLGCGAVPHQGGLNLSAILFIEHNRLFMPFQLRVHRHYDHFSRFISYDEITVRRDLNYDCIRKILHMAVYQRILIPFRHTLVEKLSSSPYFLHFPHLSHRSEAS